MEDKIIVAPSLLAADFSNLDAQLVELKKCGITHLHYDVMDGNFVPNISFGPYILSCINHYGFIMDVHLMIVDPEFYIPAFIKAGAHIITIHYETLEDIEGFASKFRNSYPDIKLGIAFNPKTEVEAILPHLHLFDLVLPMSVEPGFGGQSFNPVVIDKIKKISEVKERDNLNLIIEVDGGINAENVKSVIHEGATMIVSGTTIFKSSDLCKTIRELKGE